MNVAAVTRATNQCTEKWRLNDKLNRLSRLALLQFLPMLWRASFAQELKLGRAVLWCSTLPPPLPHPPLSPSQPGCSRWAAPAKCPGRPPVVPQKKKKEKAPPHSFPSQSRSLLGRSALFHASDVSSFVVGAKGEVPRGVDPQKRLPVSSVSWCFHFHSPDEIQNTDEGIHAGM